MNALLQLYALLILIQSASLLWAVSYRDTLLHLTTSAYPALLPFLLLLICLGLNIHGSTKEKKATVSRYTEEESYSAADIFRVKEEPLIYHSYNGNQDKIKKVAEKAIDKAKQEKQKKQLALKRPNEGTPPQ